MKKILMVLAIAGFSSAAMAQNTTNEHEVLTNRFWDNWFISAGVGAEMLLGDYDVHNGIGDRISPTFNVGIGKWFTPGLGLRVQYSGYEAKGVRNGFGRYARKRLDGNFWEQKFHYMNLHGDVLFNLNALLGGYNPDRVYEIIPYAGIGFTHSYSGTTKKQTMTANAGIINKFKVSPSLDINLELSGMLTQNKFDGEIGNKDYDGVVAATVGVTYYFKDRGFRKPKVCPPQIISEAELSGMRNRMNSLQEEVQGLKTQLAATPTVIVEENVTKIPDIAPHAIFFNIGSAKVSAQELINLGFVADQIKEYPTLKLKLTGYADSATGSAALNERLSKQRAEAVADALAKTYNISRDRMTTGAVGGVEKFEKAYLNRMVMIEVVK